MEKSLCRSGINGIIELLPGTWYAKDDQIYLLRSDGAEEVLVTNWQEMRRNLEIAERIKRSATLETIQQHQAEKREKTSKKKSGRGC